MAAVQVPSRPCSRFIPTFVRFLLPLPVYVDCFQTTDRLSVLPYLRIFSALGLLCADTFNAVSPPVKFRFQRSGELAVTRFGGRA